MKFINELKIDFLGGRLVGREGRQVGGREDERGGRTIDWCITRENGRRILYQNFDPFLRDEN